MGEPAPYEGALLKQSLLLFYRNQTDENSYLQQELLKIQQPADEISQVEELVFVVIAFGIGAAFGVIATKNAR